MEIKRFAFGKSIPTNTIVKEYKINDLKELNHYFDVQVENDNCILKLDLGKDDKIYGLGENVKGINKRGCRFKSFNEDDPIIIESRESLYASHNFLIVASSDKVFGIFLDTPQVVTFDLGFSDLDKLVINTHIGFDLYIIDSNDKYPELDIIHSFREMIGKSYIAPFWAFGVAQSRWGYKTQGDLEEVIKGFRDKDIPLDMLFCDIDCLDNFKDFTFNDTFKAGFFKECASKGIHIVPIVDAAVKDEKGYFLCDELKENNACCFDKEGKPFIVGVWPGDSVLPDFLSDKGQEIFGKGYKKYLDLGIDGFWNDMNEPALFYSKDNLTSLGKHLSSLDYNNFATRDFEIIRDKINVIKNNLDDYKSFYHHLNGEVYNHFNVHNMYGYKMVEAGSKYFAKYNQEKGINKKYLLFSRSSLIGSHRYGGIWTGDNAANWDHLLLNLKMMPSLNMCGYLYSGADIGGFGQTASEDLVLRWMSLGIFTPLFRNHTCNWVRAKDYHLLKNTNVIRNLLSIRYALVPYLYSTYIESIEESKLMFTPLSFVFRNDERAVEVEDEVMVGDNLIIAPVYKQNAKGRMVYLPTDALEVRMKSANDIKTRMLAKGDHYIEVGIDEVVFFLIKGKALPLAKINNVKNISSVNYDNLEIINNGYQGKIKLYYEEDNNIKEKIINV